MVFSGKEIGFVCRHGKQLHARLKKTFLKRQRPLESRTYEDIFEFSI